MNVLGLSSGSFDELISREWITVNHAGGYASSTPAGINTRKYHGLLVASLAAPVRRMVILSRVQETIQRHGWPYELSSSEYPGTIHPQGHQLLRAFDHHPFPRWAWQADGWTIEKQLRLIQGQNTVVLSYTLQAATEPVELELRPLFALRSIHELMGQFNGRLSAEAYSQHQWRLPATHRSPEVFFAADATFANEGCWYLNTHYRCEQERGYQCLEDLWMPGTIRWTLKPGQTVHFACSTEPINLDRTLTRWAQEADSLAMMISTPADWAGSARKNSPGGADLPELPELSQLPTDAIDLPQADLDKPGVNRSRIINRAISIWAGGKPEDAVLEMLTHAGAQFLLRTPAEPGRDPVTTISGNLHWSAPQTRNGLIGFTGLMLATGRHATARTYLQWLAMHMHAGLIPSEFPEDGAAPIYHGADISLWFVQAVWDYLRYTNDQVTVRRHFLPAIGEIIARYSLGTLLGIGVDHSGLLGSHSPGIATTWMDATVGEWMVTPRQGRTVELNALWYNALRIGSLLASRFEQPDLAGQWEYMAHRAQQSFNAHFWNEEMGQCHDVLADHGRDPSLRPNQVLAVSLPFAILEMNRHQRLLDRVTDELLTPYGLRTLSQRENGYQRRCGQGIVNRQRASHQGTVYPWLLGPYISAMLRVHGRGHLMRQQAMGWIQQCMDHMAGPGLGQMPECFDGDAPHRPGGAMAAVASVGQLLRVYVEDVLDRCPAPVTQTAAHPQLQHRPRETGRPDGHVSQA